MARILLALVSLLLAACASDQQALRRPLHQVDTGGFLLMQPPTSDIDGRLSPTAADWTGSAWGASWEACGFALASYNASTKTYSTQYWLAKKDFTITNKAAVHTFRRPGSAVTGGFLGFPLLYLPILETDSDGTRRKVTTAEFEAAVNDVYGIDLTNNTVVKAYLDVWASNEKSVPLP